MIMLQLVKIAYTGQKGGEAAQVQLAEYYTNAINNPFMREGSTNKDSGYMIGFYPALGLSRQGKI